MRAPNHLNALRAFEAAARHLSYTAAADELNVTPAAVGQLVRGLEEVLGIELFHRSPSGPSRLVLSDQARASLDKNSQYLRKWTSTKINVEGHADSRGTNEYNLSLGERRATAVRDYLVSLGVAVARINIVSLGEEQPVCREEAESCWTQNRRGHFVFTAK